MNEFKEKLNRKSDCQIMIVCWPYAEQMQVDMGSSDGVSGCEGGLEV